MNHEQEKMIEELEELGLEINFRHDLKGRKNVAFQAIAELERLSEATRERPMSEAPRPNSKHWIKLEEVTEQMLKELGDRDCRIWSGEHRMYWAKNCQGYSSTLEFAGTYTFSKAYDNTHDNCPLKKISYVLLGPVLPSGGDAE